MEFSIFYDFNQSQNSKPVEILKFECQASIISNKVLKTSMLNIPLHNFTDSKVGFSWAKQAKLMTKTSVFPIDILEFQSSIWKYSFISFQDGQNQFPKFWIVSQNKLVTIGWKYNISNYSARRNLTDMFFDNSKIL